MRSDIRIYKGNTFTTAHSKKNQTIIAFDLDETIGSFSDLYILWTGLHHMIDISKQSEQSYFNELLDLYPEFLRVGILPILDYLYLKKREGRCDKIYIYTNNTCTPPWVALITGYIQYKLKLNENLFDRIICAFKINDKPFELSRTTKQKTWSDLIQCTLLPKSTEICFVDNTYYKEMVHNKVYYIQPLAYHHALKSKTIVDRFLSSSLMSKRENMREYIEDWFEAHGKHDDMIGKKNGETDLFVAQKMMYHIKEFFYLTNRMNKTKKNKARAGRTTRKYWKAYKK